MKRLDQFADDTARVNSLLVGQAETRERHPSAARWRRYRAKRLAPALHTAFDGTRCSSQWNNSTMNPVITI